MPTEILADIINLLPVKKQLTIKSVNKRFNELALISTTLLDVHSIPRQQWFNVAKQMPKLTVIKSLELTGDGHLTTDDMAFLEKLAAINKKIVYISLHAKTYLEAVKKLDPAYTGSGLKAVFKYSDYMTLIKKYPDLDIKFRTSLRTVDSVLGDKDVRRHLSHLVELGLEDGIVWSRLPELLLKTVNVTNLRLEIHDWRQLDGSFKLYRILEQIANLPLKKLKFFTDRYYGKEGYEKYRMTDDDYLSLRKVLNISTLTILYLKIDFVVDIQNFHDVIIDSAHNNFQRINVSFGQRIRRHRDRLICCPFYDDDDRLGINVDSLTKFSIVDFMKKFKYSRTRRLEVMCGNVMEWVRIRTEFNAFIRSHPSCNYTLARTTFFDFH